MTPKFEPAGDQGDCGMQECAVTMTIGTTHPHESAVSIKHSPLDPGRRVRHVPWTVMMQELSDCGVLLLKPVQQP
jgi:hypothetical protein